VDDTGVLFPVHQFDYVTSSLVISKFGRAAVVSPEELKTASSHLAQHCKVIRRCFAVWQNDAKFVFTAFFVAPQVLATVWHAAAENPELGSPVDVRMAELCSFIPAFRLSELKSYRMNLLHRGKLPDKKAEDEMEPEANRPVTPCDFAFYTVDGFTSDMWLTPASKLPTVGTAIFSCQINGPLTSLEAYDNIPNFPKDLQLVNAALHANHWSVSEGKVLAQNSTCISISTSSCGGASGAPCIGYNQITQFCAIYCGTVKDEKLKFLPNVHNYAIHVDHPHFAVAFAKYVLPHIPETRKTPVLLEYIAKHTNQKG